MDYFTPEFKRLKAKYPPPSFSDVIDLHDFAKSKNLSDSKSSSLSVFEFVNKLCIKSPSCKKQILGLQPCADWNIFSFDKYPGFTVIQNPFVDGYQRYWVSRCLQDYPADPRNVTNLSALGDHDSLNLWQDFERVKKPKLDKQDRLSKLRWTTLGYHYNWTTKEYYEDQKSEFPEDIQCLTQYFSNCLDLGPYKAEAAIVNYYHLDSTLAGHTDHSELDHAAPLFSISFGQSAVFMLGGITKEEKPMSIFLRSGDVCVMSGQSRLGYHAVPKILSPSSGYMDYSCFCFKENSLEDANNSETDRCNTINNNCAETSHLEDVPDVKERRKNCDKNTYVPGISNSDGIEKDNMPELLKLDESNTSRKSDLLPSFQIPHTPDVPSIESLNKAISDSLRKMDWDPFDVYLKSSRINVNVRQVFPFSGISFQLECVESKAKDAIKQTKDDIKQIDEGSKG